MAIVKVSWSGGKDSTASALLHLEQGDKVIMVNYIPRFTETIPLIPKENYEFIMKAKEYFESRGAEVHIVTGKTYIEQCTHIAVKGASKGMPRGFPVPVAGKCDFSTAKKEAIQNVKCHKFDYEDIGIAFDEVKRFHNVNNTTKRSILMEKEYTTKMAYELCKQYGLLSPQYISGTRDGCSLCPNANKRERVRWLADYPEAIPILEGLQQYLLAFTYPNNTYSKRYPLIHEKLFIEHINTLFGDEIKIN